MHKLSELEGAVLALIRELESATPYAVRARFLQSRSSHFSGSAGAVYPLMTRLAENGLLKTITHQQGKRQSKRYSLSAKGHKTFLAWLAPPVEEWMAAVSFDPLRTRVLYLNALPKKQRLQFLREAEQKLLDEQLATRKALMAISENEWMAWGTEGALATIRARLKWIRRILNSDSV